jgi:hypothetical protein
LHAGRADGGTKKTSLKRAAATEAIWKVEVEIQSIALSKGSGTAMQWLHDLWFSDVCVLGRFKFQNPADKLNCINNFFCLVKRCESISADASSELKLEMQLGVKLPPPPSE